MFENATLFCPVLPVILIVREGRVDPKGGGQAPFAVIVAVPVTSNPPVIVVTRRQ
jgi:hypothetical protein